MGEKSKVAIRNIRREANEELKEKLENKFISEDELWKEYTKVNRHKHRKYRKNFIWKRKKRLFNMNKLNHVAFIMDGNSRWGTREKGRNLDILKELKRKKVVKNSIKLNIPIITFYVFSSENWKRPKKEKDYLFALIHNYFSKELELIIKQGIRINILGDITKFSSNLRSLLKKTISLTRDNKKITVNLALNYGSNIEILQAFTKNQR